MTLSELAQLKALLADPPARRLAVAESLTAGNVQARIGAIPGASTFFSGGLTAYTLAQKVNLLGVDRAEAAACDCVSETVARQMARGVADRFAVEVAVATTGYAEAAPAAGVNVPFAWWAVAERTSAGTWLERSGRVVCPGLERVGVQRRVTEVVLLALLDHLRHTEP